MKPNDSQIWIRSLETAEARRRREWLELNDAIKRRYLEIVAKGDKQ